MKTLQDAIYFVSQQVPATDDAKIEKLAKRLLEIMEEHGEPIERAWSIESYWE